jgi:hypothetical protein
MASSSSFPSTSDVVPSGAATVVQAIDVYADQQKKRYQSSLLAEHKICLCKEDFSLLVQCNLMDELIQTVEHLKSTYKAACHDTVEKEKNGVTEGTNDEETDSDEDEDYEFELSEEDDDDDNRCEENQHPEPSTTPKEVENQNIVHMTISTQISDELANISFDLEPREQREIAPDYTYPTTPISDSE